MSRLEPKGFTYGFPGFSLKQTAQVTDDKSGVINSGNCRLLCSMQM